MVDNLFRWCFLPAYGVICLGFALSPASYESGGTEESFMHRLRALRYEQQVA